MPDFNKSRDEKYYDDLIELGQWKKGMTNRTASKNITTDQLLDALNVDIDNYGKVRSRKGQLITINGACHSVWGDIDAKNGYFVHEKTLKRINSDLSLTNIIDGIDMNTKMYFAKVNGEIYFSNKYQNGKVNLNGYYDYFGISSPKVQAQITVAYGTGSLKAGTYIIAYSYLYGQYETGASPFQTVVLTQDNGSISITASTSAQATGINFYASPNNATELYRVLNTYGFNAIFSDTTNMGYNLQGETLDAFPNVEKLCYFKGRLYGVINDTIYFTEAMDYHQYNVMKNIIQIDQTPIQILAPVDDGIYVVTQMKTYFLRGHSPDDFRDDRFTIRSQSFSLEILNHNTAYNDTLYYHEDEKKLGWLSPRGHVKASYNGEISMESEQSIDFPKNYNTGAALFKKQDSIISVIFTMQEGNGGTTTTFESSDYKNSSNNNI